jgi:hypothetical protein
VSSGLVLWSTPLVTLARQGAEAGADGKKRLCAFLASEMDRTDDEAVACSLLELLVCLSLSSSSSRGSSHGACWEALRCLDSIYPLGEGPCARGRRPPAALLALLQASLGVHDLQTRCLTELFRAAVAENTPIAQVGVSEAPSLPSSVQGSHRWT